ncbi:MULTISPECIES: DUF5325 family protein [Solibacillus]|uniref:DUF5325 family protein n=1 Tax=Solibacillus merdavium TaxID=2762218 RepID=A0ABR8XI41_9BACL|nr:DUF5325 family protein [Solibacillus merdavium]MBD8031608.1 DUF5325 family protein [Solibacillus merdavium]
MNKAKFVMFIYALAAILSMISIGFAFSLVFMIGDKYETIGWIGVVVGVVVMCAIFGMAFKTKRKFRDQGLL